jgi:murein L,D-transpeptidase YcbB/YkuD
MRLTMKALFLLALALAIPTADAAENHGAAAPAVTATPAPASPTEDHGSASLATASIGSRNKAEAAAEQPTDIRSLIPVPDTAPTSLLIESEPRPGRDDAGHDAAGHDADAPDATASIDSRPAGTEPEAPAAPAQSGPAQPAILIPLPDYVPATPVISTLPPEALQTQPVRPGDLAAALDALAPKSGLPAREMAAIADYYAANGSKPLWFDGADWSNGARQIVQRLGHAAEDGLRPVDYAVALPPSGDGASFASADVSLSIAAVRYARDARGARVDPARISALIGARRTLPDTAEVLADLSAASDAGAALEAYNPQQPGYLALRAKLAALQGEAAPPPAVIIPPGRLLRTGMTDERVPLLRQRLGLPAADNEIYDDALAEAVAAFQKANRLMADGKLGRATTAALSGVHQAAASEAGIIANMERWRWLPRDLGENYVMVNIPEYTLRLVEDGKLVHSARVIVGKPQTQTPVFTGEMKYLVVNPYWNVPPSIMKKEFLPHMAADPDYAARQGYEVVRTKTGFRVRQPPGERNALGRIKFMFPNDYAVYIHDTPSRALFSNARRAYSHGCVRVQDPFVLATHVLGWSEKRIKGLLGGKERYVNLEHTIPVHMVYFTSFVDDTGRLETRPDLYGHNRKVEVALGLS